jgi:ATP-dependent DNA helicase RecG
LTYPLFHPARSGTRPSRLSSQVFRRAFPTEGTHVEFKTGVGLQPLQEAIVALSNTDGGVILIGVDDSGRVTGREASQGTQDVIHQAFADARQPGRYEIRAIRVEKTPVTVISIHRRTQGFAQTSDGRVLVRRGARNQPLFGEELLRFATEHSIERFDTSDSRVGLDAASDGLIQMVADAYAWGPDQVVDRLVDHGLAIRAGHELHLTIAGALYLLDDPSAVIPKAYVEVLRYPPGGTDYDSRRTFVGPIHRQVESATEHIISELGTEPVTLGLRRYELPRLPREVLREAISNAVAHRSYELGGTAIRIELRIDEVAISSPGSLPEPVTVDNIREAQAARNVAVIDVLRRYRLAEDVGRGVDLMQDSMQAALLDPPEFFATPHAVRVRLPVRGPVSARERAWVLELERRGRIEPQDRLLLVHAARGQVLTNSRVRHLLGDDRVEALNRLQRLRAAGLLIQSGDRGGATYILAADLVPPDEVRISPADLGGITLALAAKGPVTNAVLRGETGIDRITAFQTLDRLVRTGQLVKVGERRGARYLLPGSERTTRPRE